MLNISPKRASRITAGAWLNEMGMAEREHVVLVHGLWMRGEVMTWMARRLNKAGYVAHTYTYPSVRIGISENARRLAAFCRPLQTQGARRLHLLGHSLGGLLVARTLELLEATRGVEIGRVVLMGAPFADSAAARRLSSFNPMREALGASVAEWFASARPANLGRYEIGVIAGTRALGLGVVFVRNLARPHDGTISVSETRVPGARDHIVMNVSHSGMVISPRVIREVCEFLATGAFTLGATRCE